MKKISQWREGVTLPENCKTTKRVNERRVCRYLRIVEIKTSQKNHVKLIVEQLLQVIEITEKTD